MLELNELVGVYVSCLLAAIIFMSIVFVFAHRRDRYDYVDAAWGLVFMVIAITGFIASQSLSASKLVVIGLVMLWGTRLSAHIIRRLRSSDEEDPRYTDMRAKWSGSVAVNAYVRIFLLQAVLASIVMSSVIVIVSENDQPLSWLLIIGTGVWLLGYMVESIADDQLRTFMANSRNKGKLMTEGFWHYSRHPNYFGELTQWWGIGIIALSATYWYIGLIGPALLTVLILFVSGVRLSEKRFEGRRGWDKYKARTSVLVPLPPKE